jgi:hypothetical protein
VICSVGECGEEAVFPTLALQIREMINIHFEVFVESIIILKSDETSESDDFEWVISFLLSIP